MYKHQNKIKWDKKSGVTILEVLIVLSIIGLIAAVVGPRLIGYLGKAKSEAAQLQITQIESALQLYYIDVGRYPTENEGLAALMAPPGGEAAWQGPYLKSKEGLIDPWGRDYIYSTPENSKGVVSIESLGRDGITGGDGEDRDLSSGR